MPITENNLFWIAQSYSMYFNGKVLYFSLAVLGNFSRWQGFTSKANCTIFRDRIPAACKVLSKTKKKSEI